MRSSVASSLRRIRPTRWRRRRSLLHRTLGGALLLLLVAHPVARAASDVFQNVAPPSQLPAGALPDRYALGNYALDHHFSAVSFSLTGGLDISGVPALIAFFLADVLWQLTAFLANALITIFTFAFSLDLINGSGETGGAGALAPVAQAIRSIYQTTFGAPWLAVAIVAAGLWAMWKALIQRRYTETAGALGLSLLFCLLALWFVTQPQQTIGQASRWTNDLSGAFLSLSSTGSVGNEQQAKQQASGQLFSLLVYQPWSVLEFGGLDHCVKTPVNASNPQSVPVQPLSRNPAQDAALSQQLQSGSEVTAPAKVCVNNENKYAPHFLPYAPGSDARNSEYNALAAGDSSQLPASDPGKASGSYRLGPADKPAADAMGEGGQYPRLLMAIVVFASELGAFLLLGALSVAVVLAQVLVLLLLAFAPVALVIGVYPGRGHDFFRGWLSRLATFLARKAIYSLILAVLLAVTAAVGDATSQLGWLLSFGLQAAFFWAVFLYRHKLTGQLAAATTGTTVEPEEGTLRLAGLYTAGRLARRALPRRHRDATPSVPATRRSGAHQDGGPQEESGQTTQAQHRGVSGGGVEAGVAGTPQARSTRRSNEPASAPVAPPDASAGRQAESEHPGPPATALVEAQPSRPDPEGGGEAPARRGDGAALPDDAPEGPDREQPVALSEQLRRDTRRLAGAPATPQPAPPEPPSHPNPPPPEPRRTGPAPQLPPPASDQPPLPSPRPHRPEGER